MNTIQNVSTLRPGLLVSLKSSIKGNVSYNKVDIEDDHLLEDGSLRAKWETEKTVLNPAEQEEAVKVRSKCRSLITSICARSSFGLLCPEDKADKLAEAVAMAQASAAAFNKGAVQTEIGVFVIAGRVAQDDVSAVRAINSEVRDLLDTMESGLKRLDVSVVREAANKAKEIGAMLSPAASENLKAAISAARSAARQIVKAAETGSAAIDQATLAKIRQSRAGFLDLDAGAVLAAPEAVGRALDLAPEGQLASCPVTGEPCTQGCAILTGGQWDHCVLQDPEAERGPARVLPDDPADHPPLCGCPLCNAEYGTTARVPPVIARSIELD